MAKGSYNISASGDSNLEGEEKNNNAKQECMKSCLSPTFLRSLSLHDRPRSSRVPTKKELLKSRYRTLVSSSLEKLPSNPAPPPEARSECSPKRGFECVGVNAETEAIAQPSIFNGPSSDAQQGTGQNQLPEPDSWLEDKYMRFSVESEKLLEKTVSILKIVDEDISESFINLTKPESIALESVKEIYRNKDKTTAGCSAGSELDFSSESPNHPTYGNWRPSSESIVRSESFSEPIYENWRPSTRKRPKDVQAHSAPRRPSNLQSQSSEKSPKNMKSQSTQQSPKTVGVQPSQHSPKNAKNGSTQKSRKSLHLLAHSAEETLNFESLSSNSGNTQSLTNPGSDDVRSVEQSSKNLLSSPNISSSDDTTKVKSPIEFDLPSDRDQFFNIMVALQNRCLEYREMIRDIAVSALAECLNFSQLSVSRIRNLRWQFESQKKNFGDFKDLCCESVVFAPDSLPIDEKVTEVIQSFYLKLLQEENETFIVRLEFGLKMGEVYGKMLKLETESKKVITTLEKEILYLKKTSVGFKV